jgi:hypothetical protein
VEQVEVLSAELVEVLEVTDLQYLENLLVEARALNQF